MAQGRHLEATHRVDQAVAQAALDARHRLAHQVFSFSFVDDLKFSINLLCVYYTICSVFLNISYVVGSGSAATSLNHSGSPLSHLFTSSSSSSSDDEDLPYCTDAPEIPCICHCECQYGKKPNYGHA